MVLIFFFLLLLLIGFSSFLIQKIRKDIRLKRKVYDFGDGNAIVYVVIAMILIFIGANMFLDEPKFDSYTDREAYGKKTAQPWLVSQTWRNRVNVDSLNPDFMFNLIDAHFDPGQELGPDPGAYYNEEAFFYQYLLRRAESDDQKQVDFAQLFLGINYFYKGEMDEARERLAQVSDTTLKYYNNFLGRVNYYYGDHDLGKKNLWTEIRLNGYKEGAYRNLALIYDHEQRTDFLAMLTYTPESREYVPYSFRTGVYIRAHDIKNYIVDLFSVLGMNINIVGFSGALLILLVWMMYLLRVSIQTKTGWLTASLVVLLSAVLVFPVWLLYDFYEFGLGFKLNGEVLNDALYCIFGIGVIEEFVKIVPFLLLLFFTKKIKEPIDYILYASLSALGFAFVENFHYFQQDSLNIMHSRALTASISHMIDTSIVAYGMVLAKFKVRKNQVLYFFLFFMLAAVSHGFYDFWLLNDTVKDFSLITLMYLLTSILIYASFINNALNNSTDPSANIRLNTAKLSSDLAACLVGIFLFEYMCLTWIYGPTIGNRELITSILGGGYLILFLSIRLSNIDVFPGEWYRIAWFVGFSPLQFIYGDRKPNYNFALGKRIRIQNFRPKGKLSALLPVEGNILRRENIRGSTGWYLVKLDPKIPFNQYNHEYIVVRPKDPMKLLNKNEDNFFHFAAINNLDALSLPKKPDDAIAFIDWVNVREV